jgi:putative transposase
VSERRSCAVLRFCRRTHRYISIRPDQAPLRERIKDIAATRVRYGYRRIHVLLRREGWKVNHKRVRRLYREEGLNLRAKRPRRHVTAARRMERAEIAAPNQVWSMDFVSDALFNGKRFRALTVVDAFTRQCLAIEVDQGIRGDQVVRVMERLRFQTIRDVEHAELRGYSARTSQQQHELRRGGAANRHGTRCFNQCCLAASILRSHRDDRSRRLPYHLYGAGNHRVRR